MVRMRLSLMNLHFETDSIIQDYTKNWIIKLVYDNKFDNTQNIMNHHKIAPVNHHESLNSTLMSNSILNTPSARADLPLLEVFQYSLVLLLIHNGTGLLVGFSNMVNWDCLAASCCFVYGGWVMYDLYWGFVAHFFQSDLFVNCVFNLFSFCVSSVYYCWCPYKKM